LFVLLSFPPSLPHFFPPFYVHTTFASSFSFLSLSLLS
jgi:hypothetical protein